MFNYLLFYEAIGAVGVIENSAADSVTFADIVTATGGIPATSLIVIEESLTVTDGPVCNVGVLLTDWVLTTANLTNNYKGTESLSENLIFTDLFLNFYNMIIAESLTVSDAVVSAMGCLLQEILTTGDTLHSNWTGTDSLSELITLIESIKDLKGYGESVSDSMTITDSSILGLYLSFLVAELATMSESETVERVAPITLESSVTIAGNVSSQGRFNDTLTEEIRLILTVKLNGEEYQCWSFTGSGMMPVMYTNYAFNSFAVIGSQVYGCKDDGIYLIDGATDAGTAISTGVHLDYGSMGTHLKKRLYHAFFGLVGESPVLKVIVDDNAADGIEYYIVNGKAHLAKGVAGREWELQVTDIDELEFVEITPVILSR